MANLKKKQESIELSNNVRREAFQKKYEEYDKLTLEELYEIFNRKGKKNRIGGAYKLAMIEVVRKKLQEKVIAEANVVSEMPQVNTESTNVDNNTEIPVE